MTWSWPREPRENAGIYAALPFDAQMLYAFRLDNARSEARDEPEARRALSELRECMKQIPWEKASSVPDSSGAAVGVSGIEQTSRKKTRPGRLAGIPVPYAAILKADGDRMGKFLSRADSADLARAISQALHGFASGVPGIVREHRGHAIYAGGDDVLALVPLARALDCSRKLAEAFRDSLRGVATEMDVPADERPTLSVGLGIGHLMEPLGALRARAERAEHAAKEGGGPNTARNALAITLGIRSGAEIGWRAQWSDRPAFDALATMTDAFRHDRLPTRAAYDLRGIDLRLDWLRSDDSPRARGMRGGRGANACSTGRAFPGGDGRIPNCLRDLIVERAQARPLKELADTLIVARWLSARTDGDLGERA